MKRLEHESQANEMFVSVTEQYKNEVRSKVIEHIRQTITLILGYCATEDENLVVNMSEISKYEQTIKIEVVPPRIRLTSGGIRLDKDGNIRLT